MSMLVIFALGYLSGGVTALLVLGLTVAARRGDRDAAAYVAPQAPREETIAAWRHKG